MNAKKGRRIQIRTTVNKEQFISFRRDTTVSRQTGKSRVNAEGLRTPSLE